MRKTEPVFESTLSTWAPVFKRGVVPKPSAESAARLSSAWTSLREKYHHGSPYFWVTALIGHSRSTERSFQWSSWNFEALVNYTSVTSERGRVFLNLFSFDIMGDIFVETCARETSSQKSGRIDGERDGGTQLLVG